MKIFKSHHNSLKHALFCSYFQHSYIFFNNATLPIQRVTIIQNAFLSIIKCAILLLTLGAATWNHIFYLHVVTLI